MSVDELEKELCSLSARMAEATCAFLMAAGEFDRRRGWEPWECHDMASWLSWKCGISPVTAREQVRVATSLGSFALVRERFATGQLSYSQVRAITRVATAETEEQLVEMAGYMTAAQLETALRGYRRSSRASDELTEKRLTRMALSYSWDDDGNLVGRFCLPAEEGALFAAAIDAATSHGDVEAADREGAWNPPAAARADALMQLVSDGANTEASGSDDDRYLVTILVEEKTLQSDDDATDSDPGVCHVSDGPGLSAETARRLTCDGPTVTITEDSAGKVVGVGRRTRRPNRPLERALRHRDHHCQYPSCTRRGHLHGHHIHHWINGGLTNLDNMILLCHRHHRRLHEGGFKMERLSDGSLRFFNRNGVEVPAVPAPLPTAVRDSAESWSVTPYSCQWDGGRPDYPMIVDTLLQSDGLLAATAS
ncbi:MAG TPA: DUF222 domain-containing protein [Acidimicrobiales bacterium]